MCGVCVVTCMLYVSIRTIDKCCCVAVFNVGEYRRRVVANFTHTNSAEFFHPDNVEANAIRELVSLVSFCTVLLLIFLSSSVIQTVLCESLFRQILIPNEQYACSEFLKM